MPAPAGEVAGESVQQGLEVVLGEERNDAVGDDHGRPVGGDVVQQSGSVRSAAMLWALEGCGSR